MALDLPTTAELTALEDNELDEATAIQQAADLFTLATGITETPGDEFSQRLIKGAILQMAWALRTQHDDLEEVFSPFLSERVGSYSYSKTYSRINSEIQAKKTTGVPLFDEAVEWFNKKAFLAKTSSSSEHVFKNGEPWVSNKSYRRERREDYWDDRDDPHYRLRQM